MHAIEILATPEASTKPTENGVKSSEPVIGPQLSAKTKSILSSTSLVQANKSKGSESEVKSAVVTSKSSEDKPPAKKSAPMISFRTVVQ